MKRLGHATVVDARRELVRCGYVDVHTLPHDPIGRWRKVKDRRAPELAIQREQRARSVVWNIVEAPPAPPKPGAAVLPPGAQLDLLGSVAR